MGDIRDWSSMREMSARLLKQQTGEDVETWNSRLEKLGFRGAGELRRWLTDEGVTGYAQNLLVMEQFGYPDFLLASADELIDAQDADRPDLRPILDRIIGAMAGLGEVTIQARKGYVSFVSPRRTFARARATTLDRVDLGFRLEGEPPRGRLVPSRIHPTMEVQVGLSSPEDVDSEVLDWLQRAYDQNT